MVHTPCLPSLLGFKVKKTIYQEIKRQFSRALCYDDLQGALPQNQMPSDEPLQTEEFAVAAEKSTIDLYENYAGNSPDKRHRTQEASHRTVIKGWAGGD